MTKRLPSFNYAADRTDCPTGTTTWAIIAQSKASADLQMKQLTGYPGSPFVNVRFTGRIDR